MSGYIGINNKAKKIKSLYIGVNNKAKKVKSAYIGISNKARKWYPGDFPPGPNDQYESKSLGNWNSARDVDDFFNTYKPDNGWKGLKLGNYVKIWHTGYGVGMDEWEIAGFNMEHNQKAADGTTYDNGYGICMIPRTYVSGEAGTTSWNDYDDLYGYAYSTMHTSHLPNICNALYTTLGNHLINRNVLLSNSVDSNYHSDSYTWTTAYATLMSVGQLTGTFAQYNNKYDDGEANYKLPLFNFENYYGYEFWLRGVWGHYEYSDIYYAWITHFAAGMNARSVSESGYIRPLIYLR